jgi:hypothetical protein
VKQLAWDGFAAIVAFLLTLLIFAASAHASIPHRPPPPIRDLDLPACLVDVVTFWTDDDELVYLVTKPCELIPEEKPVADVILHDHLNPDQEVIIEADAIVAVTPFGSGSAVEVSSGGTIGVHETPAEVERLKQEALN